VSSTRRLVAAGILLLVAEGCAARRPVPSVPQPPRAALTRFVATAYCQGTTTAAGVAVRPGIVAADPRLLPLGTVIHVARSSGYDGVYTVLDTGPQIQGRRLDLFMRDCAAARRFGRRTVDVSVVTPRAVARP
jgi:3D (Asp-Asp-Asp) domain-containing protein